MELGRVGIWSAQLRGGDRAEAEDAAAELDELGFGALWIPSGPGGDIFENAGYLLEATRRVVVATGILSIWRHAPAEAAAARHLLAAAHPERFLLGLGVSHRPSVEMSGQRYERPLTRMREYLDDLDALSSPVPKQTRILAALGPKMLELARVRACGAHPYLVTPEQTASARAALRAGPLLAPEQMVVFDADVARAREVARAGLALYLRLPNYLRNLRRAGFAEDDLTEGGSNRLVDHLVAWGTVEGIARRIAAHHDAGADHVCVQVLTSDPSVFPRAQWRELAAVVS